MKRFVIAFALMPAAVVMAPSASAAEYCRGSGTTLYEIIDSVAKSAESAQMPKVKGPWLRQLFGEAVGFALNQTAKEYRSLPRCPTELQRAFKNFSAGAKD
jgi:hypothetical protein